MPPKRLSNPISLRLDPDKLAILEAEADRRCIKVIDLIRERLDISAAVQGPLDSLRDELVYSLGRGNRSGVPGADGGSGLVNDALLIEVVLSLRQVLSPAQRRDVTNSVVSIGLEPWTAERIA